MSAIPTSAEEKQLREALKKDPADWEARKQLAHLLYDQGAFQKAADVIWEVDEIPSIDLELAFAARVLAKASPRKAIRLLSALLELNHGKAVQNLGLANALLHHGMVLQAARFYGAALEADPSLGNPDLEHFILWTDDEETLWGDFKDRQPKLGDLPWMKRDPLEAMKLTSRVSTHTTPIRLASLKPAPGEELRNELYQQTPAKGAQPSPPPAVTIPVDRVDPKDRLFDPELGAPDMPPPAKQETPAPAMASVVVPTRSLATPQFTTPPKPPASVPPPVISPAAKAPDAKAPDAKAPDVKAPDVKAPDVKAPDVKAPAAKAPDAEELFAKTGDFGSEQPPSAGYRRKTVLPPIRPKRPDPAG